LPAVPKAAPMKTAPRNRRTPEGGMAEAFLQAELKSWVIRIGFCWLGISYRSKETENEGDMKNAVAH
jgi:hypothetical protein